MLGARLEIMGFHRLFGGDQQAGRGIAILAGDAGGDDAVFMHRLQCREARQRGAGAHGFVHREIAKRRDFGLEPAIIDGGLGAAMRFQGVDLHRLARDAPFIGDHFS